MEESFKKVAFFGGSGIKRMMTNKDGSFDLAKGLVLGSASAFGLSRTIKKIMNDQRRKALIEDLANYDPILKEADRQELLEYYATLYTVAPELSLDKNSVREVLRGFVKFGRVDMQTLKTLSETQRNLAQNGSGGDSMIMSTLKTLAG